MRRFRCYRGRARCGNCDKEFLPRWNWQIYCGKRCYQFIRRFRMRMRYDQHKVWKSRMPNLDMVFPTFAAELETYNRFKARPRHFSIHGAAKPHGRMHSLYYVITVAVCLGETLVPAIRFAALGIPLIVSACAKPRTQAEIPEPVGKNVILAWDGEKYIWTQIVGGPSGAIDASSHPFEIELVDHATAKYLRSPVTYASEPKEGTLVVYGPAGTTEQAVTASGMTASLVGIENGILVPGELPATANVERSAYYPAVNASFNAQWPGHGWTLPSKGYATLGSTTAPDGTRSGHLSFPAGAETSAVLRWQIDGAWDKTKVHYFDLAWWSGGTGAAGTDTISVTLDYACTRDGSSAGATDPAWVFIATKPIVAGPYNTLDVASFNSPLSGCNPGDYVLTRIRRRGTSAENTFKAAFNLDGLSLRWTQEVK